MSDKPPVWVLLKWYEGRNMSPDDVTVHSIHESEQSVLDRIEVIRKANKQYPLRQIGRGLAWRVGPDEDEGFFGNSPVMLRAHRYPKAKPNVDQGDAA